MYILRWQSVCTCVWERETDRQRQDKQTESINTHSSLNQVRIWVICQCVPLGTPIWLWKLNISRWCVLVQCFERIHISLWVCFESVHLKEIIGTPKTGKSAPRWDEDTFKSI